MTRTAWNDGPDIDYAVMFDDVIGVVPVDGPRRVAGQQLDDIAHPQRLVRAGDEDGVLFVDTHYRQVVVRNRG